MSVVVGSQVWPSSAHDGIVSAGPCTGIVDCVSRCICGGFKRIVWEIILRGLQRGQVLRGRTVGDGHGRMMPFVL